MPNYCKIVEKLLITRGEKKGYYFMGDITTREILEEGELPINPVNHNRILHTIKSFYPASSFGDFSKEDGYVIHVRIRTK